MSKKLIQSIVENGNLTDFNTTFNEEVTARVKVLIKEMETKIKAEFDLSEEADIIGKETDKKVDAEDKKDKGPSEEPDADEDEEDREHMDEKKSSDKNTIYKDGVRYEYDGKTDLYYDSETDVYVTSNSLGV